MSLMIGSALQNAFHIESLAASGEIALFRAFIRAFNSLGANALTQEYHGNRYQVKFSANRGTGRPVPRCELCDVMIIHYPAGNPRAARVTFNQAKVSSNPLQCAPVVFSPYKFRANLEQWDLLSNRPSISATTAKINFPADLLSNALLPSVGTFGVFYPKGQGFDFAYFVANGLSPLKNNYKPSGTLQWNTQLGQVRKIGHYDEITATCCMYTFGKSLELGLIGTPLQQVLYGSTGTTEMRIWLGSMLSSLQEMHPDSDLPSELAEGFELTHEEPSRKVELSTPRAVVLVRTE
ncbi:hypothetical protein DMW62_28980 [Serratia marcescens]|uniref:Uncharacterized protein n=2 Tax=Serratia TaxID=613 RepID=A0ABX5N3G9_SERMA|nr:hypothetical protein [Serratia marcescens]PXZ91555.1 hypothetical protein CW300_24125 [Serratia marcescens]PYA18760.1 hypothetical protein DMW41_27515 [Serratia marcescens]PYA20114.1 hypothetical protein DMW40_27455 [Serratia marcescens]PYA23154.1 hypothetical protein DMW50_29005 [Serratia marcescens]